MSRKSDTPPQPFKATVDTAPTSKSGEVAGHDAAARAEKRGCETDTLVRDAIEIAPMGYFRTTPDGRFLAANTRLADMYGYASVQELMDNIGNIGNQLYVNPEDREQLLRACEDAPVHMMEVQRRRKDGSIIWTAMSMTAVKDQSGKVLYYEGFTDDITEKRQTVEALRESEAKYRTVVDNISDIFYRTDSEGRLIMASPSALKALGYDSEDEILGLPVKVFWKYPEQRADFIARIREHGGVSDYEMVLLRKDGTSMFCSANSRFYHDAEGRVLGIQGIVRDITERKHAEEALRRSETLLGTLVDTIPDLVWLKNADGVYLDCNPSFQSIFGLGKADFIGNTDYDIFDADIADFFRKHDLKAIEAGESRTNEEWVTSAEGHRVLLETVKTPMYAEDGVLLGVLGVARDITLRKQTEKALEKRIIALTRPLKDAEVDFEDLFNIADIQQLQDVFSEATGVASLITRPDGSPVTAPSNFCSLCKDIIRKTEKGLANCFRSDAILGRPNPDGPVVRPCMSGGLWDAGAGISVGGKHVANWLIGQVRDETQTEEEMRAYAREIGADENQFIEAFKQVPAMSRERFGQVAEALFTFANQLSTIAYQNVQQARFIEDMKQVESKLRQESILNQAQAALAQAISAPDASIDFMATTVHEQAMALTGSAHGLVSSIDPVSGDNVAHTQSTMMGHGESGSGDYQTVFPKGKDGYGGLLGHALNTREAFFSNEPPAYPGASGRLPEGHVALKQFMAVPALCSGELLGLIALANPGRDYTEGDLEKVKPLADLFALSVQRMRYVESLKASKEAAEAASKAKSEFLANMSHEIRTPLNGVFGMLQLLEDAPLAPKEAMYVQNAIGATKRLTQLLSDILDLSRIEAGKMSLTREMFNIFDLGPAITDIFALRAREKGLDLSVHIDERLPSKLLGDQVRIRQILFNLVGNAIKFTATGKVAVDISPLPAQCESRVWVLIIVKDTGIGIADEDLDRIFEPFAQVEGLLVRSFGGSGLGLSIVRKLLKLMNGSMTLSSEVGEGTEFYFSIPLELPASSEVRAPSLDTGVPAAGKRILVVEDEPINQLCIKDMLEKAGYDVSTADNGQEALSMVGHGDFDCILMDLQMPVMDGIEATLALRGSSHFGKKASTPVIALTAYAMQGDRERCLEAGMDSYLSKPIQREALLAAIGAYTS